jgi:hypothetical protein
MTVRQMASRTPPAEDGDVTPDTWCVVVVRAWVDGGRLTVRLLATGDCGERTSVVTSIDAASRELAGALAAIAIRPVEDGGDDHERTPE